MSRIDLILSRWKAVTEELNEELQAQILQVSQLKPHESMTSTTPTLKTLNEAARDYVLYVLRQHDGNKSHAAEALGIDRRTLYRYLEHGPSDGRRRRRLA